MTTKLMRTRYPGIYRRGERYVITWRDRGRQRKEFFRTLDEAREAKGRRMSGDRRKPARTRVEKYAPVWVDHYRGRTARGFSESTRVEYRREIDQHVLPYFGQWRMDEIEAQDVKEWLSWL